MISLRCIVALLLVVVLVATVQAGWSSEELSPAEQAQFEQVATTAGSERMAELRDTLTKKELLEEARKEGVIPY